MGTYRCRILNFLMHEKDANVGGAEAHHKGSGKRDGGHVGEGIGSVLEFGLH